MIRLSLLNEHHQVLRVSEYAYNRVRIGRGAANDFILTDPKVSRNALVVEQKQNSLVVHQKGKDEIHVNKIAEIPIGESWIVVEYLNPAEDDITLNDFHIPKASREWVVPILSFAVLIIFQLLTYFLYDISSGDFSKQVKFWSTTIIGELLVIMFVALLSKAINGQYRFARILQIFSFSGILLLLAQTRLFGFLWSLGEWTWYSETRHVVFIAVLAASLWLLGQEVFDHTPKWLRITLLVGLLAFGSLSEFLGNLPLQEKWNYLTNEVPPPMPNWMESKVISVDDLILKMNGAKPKAPSPKK